MDTARARNGSKSTSRVVAALCRRDACGAVRDAMHEKRKKMEDVSHGDGESTHGEELVNKSTAARTYPSPYPTAPVPGPRYHREVCVDGCQAT